MAHASRELVLAVSASIGSSMLLVVSSAMVSSNTVLEELSAEGGGGQKGQNQCSTMPIKPEGVAQAPVNQY